MNFTDILIIYLACGAPFGVYYFLQNRRKKDFSLFWIKTFFNFAFWLPFALGFFLENKIRQNFYYLNPNNEKKIFLIQKQIESILHESKLKVSIYDYREIFDRYLGLTISKRGEAKKTADTEKEIFRITGHKQVELAAICLQRRNQKRLFYHHTLARQDFLQFIAKLFKVSSGKIKLGNLSVEFVKLLDDTEAQTALEKLFAENSQTDKQSVVKHLEKDLWNPNKHAPLSVNPISTHLPSMTTTANLPVKD